MRRWLTPNDIADLECITRQAVIMAIKSGRLRAVQEGRFWKVANKDYREYFDNLYSRTLSSFQGKRVYNKKQGVISVKDAAELLDVPEQKIYYAIRSGKLLGERVGPGYVIQAQFLRAYSKHFLKKNFPRKIVS